jgi:hypothetical protein
MTATTAEWACAAESKENASVDGSIHLSFMKRSFRRWPTTLLQPEAISLPTAQRMTGGSIRARFSPTLSLSKLSKFPSLPPLSMVVKV